MPVIAVSATFTAEPLQEILDFWNELLKFGFQVKFAPYNQVFQQLLDPASLLARNRNGISIVLARFEDWAWFQQSTDLERLEENVRHLVSCVQTAAATSASPLLVGVCPDSPRFLADPAQAAFARRMQDYVVASLAPLAAVHVITPARIAELYPVPDYYDPHAEALGHVPYTPEFYAALGTMLARRIAALRMPPFKVIALDCDNTLWQGICGEDGPAGVVLDPPRRALQEFMRAQIDSGMLLAVASKNNEDDVLETFAVHPEMPLRPEHFIAMRANWEPKSENLAQLSEDLQLGLDTFILVDDSAEQCAEMQAGSPEVLALPLPEPAENIPEFLKHVWAFDHARVTAEDRSRTALYSQQAERARLERQAGSIEEFINSLRLDVRIAPIAPEQLLRVAQLTNRTNQMNATAVRRSESNLQAALATGAECLTVDVTDRFGSYGLCGVIIFRSSPPVLAVDTFLLSCRALGRGIEHRMLAHLGRLAVERGLERVDVPFIPAQRNRPAKQFLESCGAQFAETTTDGVMFRFPAEYASSIVYKPGAAAKTTQPPAARSVSQPLRPDYLRIANELRTPGRILEAARACKRPEVRRPATIEPPRTDLEARLVALWADLLRIPALGIHDNFFDLGGHSLLAVQLLSRVRQEFDIDLSLEIVYDGAFTVATLTEAIELRQIERELDGVSEDELRAMLAEEQPDADPKQ